MQKRLNELKIKDTGTFVAVDSEDGALVTRMAAMGVVAGRPFEITKIGPGTIVFRATTTTIALRDNLASLIVVEVPDA